MRELNRYEEVRVLDSEEARGLGIVGRMALVTSDRHYHPSWENFRYVVLLEGRPVGCTLSEDILEPTGRQFTEEDLTSGWLKRFDERCESHGYAPPAGPRPQHREPLWNLAIYDQVWIRDSEETRSLDIANRTGLVLEERFYDSARENYRYGVLAVGKDFIRSVCEADLYPTGEKITEQEWCSFWEQMHDADGKYNGVFPPRGPGPSARMWSYPVTPDTTDR
jgi:hypothetical protein